MKYYFILFFVLYKTPLKAQIEIVKGVVKDQNNNPIQYANVILTDYLKSNETIAYTFTDSKGLFFLKAPFTKNQHLQIKITAMNFKEKVYSFLIDTVKELNFVLLENYQQLEAITVKKESIKDTFDLKIDSLGLTKESTLRDILKKTEGVQINEDGAISFNGKLINKVLINGKEVFINQNKVAVDNLNYEMMDNVQIINNYKDKFNIDFNNPTNPIINVNTKKKFKGVLKFQTDIAYGYNEVYKLKLKEFYFSDILNTFLTSNTNNISEKEFSFKDAVESISTFSTENLKEKLVPFFIADNNLLNSFNNNNAVTFRKQTQKTKIGAVISISKLNTNKTNSSLISNVDTLIKNDHLKTNFTGNLLTTNFNHSYLVKKNTVLNSFVKVVYLDNVVTNDKKTVLYLPTIINLNEFNTNKTTLYSINVSSTFTSIFKKKYLMDILLNYNKENNNEKLYTYLNTISNQILQEKTTIKDILNFAPSFAFKITNWLSIKSGVSYLNIIDKPNLKKNNIFTNQINYTRSQNIFETPILINGLTKSIEYSIELNPTTNYLFTINKINKNYFNYNTDITYKFNPSENINIQLNKKTNVLDMSNSFDTTFQSFNYKLINDPINFSSFSILNKFNIGYYYSNIAKSKSFFINYIYLYERENTSTLFDTFINNVFIYKNIIFPKKQTYIINIGLSKGFYIKPQYHKIEFYLSATLLNEQFLLPINYIEDLYLNKKFIFNNEIVCNFKNKIIKEIVLGLKIESELFEIESKTINKQNVINPYFKILIDHNKFIGSMFLENSYFSSIYTNFQIPNFNFSLKYKFNDKMFVEVIGKSILDIINKNKILQTDIQTQYNGNIISQNINNSRLNYILFNLNYKF